MYANGASTVPYVTATNYIGGNETRAGGSIIADATESISGAVGRVDKIIAQLRNIADTAFGSQPSGESAGNPAAPSSSRTDDLRRATTALHDILGALEAEVARYHAL